MISKFVSKLKKIYQQTHQLGDEREAWQSLQLWYTTVLGKRLAKYEKRILGKYLPNLFGYFLVQCGCPEIKVERAAGKWLTSSRVSTRFCVDYEVNQGVNFQTHLAQLPVKSDSIDIVVLPHVLEFSTDPHQVLREVERVLIAEGHVIILGFNPWSIWNVVRLFYLWKKPVPWRGHFLTASRVMDWLALLGFDVVQRKGYFYQPPIQNEQISKRLRFLDKIGHRFWPNFGACYVLVARKRVQTLTPIRSRWRNQRHVVTTGLETINRNKF